jgi:hypothetical protein
VGIVAALPPPPPPPVERGEERVQGWQCTGCGRQGAVRALRGFVLFPPPLLPSFGGGRGVEVKVLSPLSQWSPPSWGREGRGVSLCHLALSDPLTLICNPPVAVVIEGIREGGHCERGALIDGGT